MISRSSIFELQPLSKEDVATLIQRAVYDVEKGMGSYQAVIDDDAVEFLADIAGGDARSALNAVELGVLTTCLLYTSYGVNASVPKTLVRHLVHYYADTCEDQELKDVLYDVLDTPVSPELLPPKDGEIAQKTEDLVGPYELHDFYLYYVLRFGYEPEKIYRLAKIAFDGEYDNETMKKWLRTFYWRFFSQQFKRSCLPDGPKVGTVALSPRGDFRMPSDACATVWLNDVEKLS